ncbi:winged helix-turn-helix domain-containing protein [Halalkalibacter krulwichiae]|uniref:Transcriptional regulatory protein SrrA n=1 Tax=Halalkalibacter krulwichiae TaxID=199441 RepID=A0A1X9MAK0_9BACI|nr:winged helix-turn-helix domain-containing protein [Halalkalibacter krulwichiae]ARK29620.1 Transcriptional regulatory protein SrrA [Halalkalibacter krulwichiae]
MTIELNEAEFLVTVENESVQLLRKEFLLFAYLYRHKEKTFTREQLLDAVWRLESPSDRTVDDHIYRLRKKLNRWCNLFRIETKKGYGYCLKIVEVPEKSNPLMNNREFIEQTNKLFRLYYMYGQGKAIETLISSPSLAVPLDPKQQLLSMIIKGEYKKILESEHLSELDKVYIYIDLYVHLEGNLDDSIAVTKKVLATMKLESDLLDELMYISLPIQYLLNNQMDEATEQIELAKKKVNTPDNGFYPIVLMIEFMLYLRRRQLVVAKKKIEEVEQLLIERPYQRELGMASILRGLLLFAEGNAKEAKENVNVGLEIVQGTKNEYYFLFCYTVIISFLNVYQVEQVHVRFYQALQQSYFKRHHLDELKPIVVRKISHLLTARA